MEQIKEKSMINDLTVGPVQGRLLKFALPYVLGNLLQTFYNLVDMIVVGRFVGQAGLSAVSVGGDLMNLFTFMSMGFCSAGQVMISQYVGKKERDNVSKTIGTFSTFMIALALVCTAIGLVFKNYFLEWMNTPAESRQQAYEYIMVCYIGLVFIFGYNIVAAVLRGMGNSKMPLVFVAIATVVNLILDYLFVAIFDSGAMGAAIATVFGQGVAFICALVYLVRHKEAFGFDFKLKSFTPDSKILKIMMRLGIPMALQMSAINISGLVVNSFLNSYGVVASAVTGVGNKINSMASIVTVGLNQAGASMIGQNYAAGKQDRVVKIMTVVGVYSLVFAAVLSAVMLITPEGVFGLFSDSEEVLAMAASYSIVSVLSFFGFASRAPFMSLITGQGFAVMNFIIGIVDSVIARIGLSILLGRVFDMGVMGFWIGSVTAGYCCTLIGAIYFYSGKWKLRPLAVR